MRTKVVHLSLLILPLLFAGCASTNESPTNAFFEGLGRTFGEIIKDAQILGYSNAWYYRVHKRWPENFAELKAFVEEEKAPIDLSPYESVEFKTLEDGSLECKYTVTSETGTRNGTLTMTESEAEDMNFGLPSSQNSTTTSLNLGGLAGSSKSD